MFNHITFQPFLRCLCLNSWASPWALWLTCKTQGAITIWRYEGTKWTRLESSYSLSSQRGTWRCVLGHFHFRLSEDIVLMSGMIKVVFVWVLDVEEFNVFGRVGPACLLCLVSGYSVTAQRRPCQAGHALAPPQGFWKVHISPKCHFNSSELPLMQPSAFPLSPCCLSNDEHTWITRWKKETLKRAAGRHVCRSTCMQRH